MVPFELRGKSVPSLQRRACIVMLAASCLQFHRRELLGSSRRPMHSRLSFLFRFVNLGLFGTRVPGSLENSLIMRNLTAINWMPIPFLWHFQLVSLLNAPLGRSSKGSSHSAMPRELLHCWTVRCGVGDHDHKKKRDVRWAVWYKRFMSGLDALGRSTFWKVSDKIEVDF